MKKKIITITVIAVLAIAMGTTALATTVLDQPQKATTNVQTQLNCGFGFGRGGGMMSTVRGLMMDENGNLLDKEVFEAKLDAAIKDGAIKLEDKEFFLERYENCANNGGMMQGRSGMMQGRKGRNCGR